MRKTIIAPVVIVLAAMIAACSSVDCPVENTVATVYKLQKGNGAPDTLNTDTLTITSLMADGKTDTILLNRSVNTTSFQLPVSYTKPVDTLFVTLADTSKTSHRVYHDTIYVSKTNSPHFESVDCPILYFHEITAVEHTRHRIDSIVINKSSVTYDLTKEHLHLYFSKP